MTTAVLAPRRVAHASSPMEAAAIPGFFGPVLAIVVLCLLQRAQFPLPPIVIAAVGAPIMFLVFRSAMTRANALPLLLAITIYVPFSKIYVGGFGGLLPGFNLTNILTVVALVAWMVARPQTGEPAVVRTPLNGPLLVFFGLAGVSLLLGQVHFSIGHLVETAVVLKRWLDPFLLYFIFVNLVRTREEIRYLTIILLITVFAAGVLAYFEHWDRLGYWDARRRVQGLSLHANTAAAFFVYYLFLFPGLLLTLRFRWRNAIWLAVAAFVCLRAIMFTGSRGALLAFAVGAAFLAFARARTLFLCAVVVALFFYFNPGLLPQVVQSRFGGLFTEAGGSVQLIEVDHLEKSLFLRIAIWEGALRMISDAPILGVGYGAFRRLIPFYTDETVFTQLDAHNTYLLIAAEMGIPALLLFLGLIALVFRESWRLYRTTDDRFLRGLGLGFCAGIVALLVAAMFGSRFNSFELTGYFWILAALVTRANILHPSTAHVGTPRRAPRVRFT